MKLIFTIIILAIASDGFASPDGWPDAFRITAREGNGAIVAVQETVIAWDDSLGGYFGVVSDQDVFLSGSNLNAINATFGGGSSMDIATMDLSTRVAGQYNSFTSSSSFTVIITFLEAIGYESLTPAQATQVLIAGWVLGVGAAYLFIPYAMLQNGFASLARTIYRA